MNHPVVFSDLDGTLLDHASYTCAPALPALRLLRERGIPLVLCSSKTRSEIEDYRRLLGNSDPFVSENGGGIFIPEGYFDPAGLPPQQAGFRDNGYQVIPLGSPYPLLRQALRELQDEGFAVTGFGDMPVAEVAAATGLAPDQAALAKQREFDEPFIWGGRPERVAALLASIQQKGYYTTRGAFFHLLGKSDKGRAVELLADLFRQKLGGIRILALGDSPNDLPMLECADQAVVVRKADGSHDCALSVPQAIKTVGIGPAGWNEAILHLLGETP